MSHHHGFALRAGQAGRGGGSRHVKVTYKRTSCFRRRRSYGSLIAVLARAALRILQLQLASCGKHTLFTALSIPYYSNIEVWHHILRCNFYIHTRSFDRSDYLLIGYPVLREVIHHWRWGK